MIALQKPTFLNPTKEFRRLNILLSVHRQAAPSQHKIARETGISSAMVNNYIKKMVDDGTISMTTRNNRDFNYRLTEPGNRVLNALLLKYSAEIVQLFSETKQEIARRLHPFLSAGHSETKKIVLHGASETCEIVMQALEQFSQVKIVGIADNDPERQHSFFHDHLIIPPEAISSLAPDYIIITSFAKQDEIYKEIKWLEKHSIEIVKLTTL